MQNIYTVAQINSYIKNMFTQDYMLQSVLVKGEVSTSPCAASSCSKKSSSCSAISSGLLNSTRNNSLKICSRSSLLLILIPRHLAKGARVEIFNKKVKVELAIVMEYGFNIPATCQRAQSKVKSAIENMTGLEVTDVKSNSVILSEILLNLSEI